MDIFVALWEAFNQGKIDEARMIQEDINKMRSIFKIGPYVSAYKYAIEKRGLKFGGFRAPVRDLTKEEFEKFEAAYKKADFIKKWEL